MAGIFAATTSLAKILTIIKNGNPDDIKQMKDDIAKAVHYAKIDGSITKLLGNFIVEPVVIISKDARKSEIADKIINLNTDIFASFYLQAFNVLMNMYGFDPTMTVNLLSSNSPSIPATVFGKAIDVGINWVANEDFKDYYGDLLNNKYLTVSTESVLKNSMSRKRSTADIEETEKEILKDSKFNYKNDKTEALAGETLYFINTRELNITIDGTMVDISNNYTKNNLEEDSYAGSSDPRYHDVANTRINNTESNTKRSSREHFTFSIPITIKTHIIVTPMDSILNMLKPNDRTKKFGYRLDEWKSGAISLKDLIFCGDLIDKYKKNKLKDKDGLLSIIKTREESANAKALSGNMVGFEKFYNMLIVTADEKVLLNKHLAGNIDNEKYKQELLTEAHALTVSILDEDYERAYILTKDIRGRSDVTYKSLLKKSDKSTDAADIVKALMMNKAPAF